MMKAVARQPYNLIYWREMLYEETISHFKFRSLFVKYNCTVAPLNCLDLGKNLDYLYYFLI